MHTDTATVLAGSRKISPAAEVTRSGPAVPTVQWRGSFSEMEPLAGSWRELEARVESRSVLATFDYNATWYHHYEGAPGGDPLIGVARRGSDLVGIAPLVIRRRRIGRVPLTCVEFAAHEAYAGEFLVEDSHPETTAMFLDSLVREAKFDLICLNDIDLTSDRYAALRETALRHRLRIEVTDHPNAIVDLRPGYDRYFRGRSSHFRASIRRHARLIEAVGKPAVGGVQLTRGLEELEGSISRLIAINEASYKLNGQRLADCHRGFLSEMARRFGPRGMLAMPILAIGGRDAAFVFGLVERNCFYDITLAYDEGFARLSPGMHLIQEMLRDLAAAGVQTVVSHGAHDYKKHWASEFVPSTRVFLFAPGLRAAATRFIRFSLGSAWRRLGYEDA
jgi:CelD/BcsL family acetyltransferase involved in cellulose biosynthesis